MVYALVRVGTNYNHALEEMTFICQDAQVIVYCSRFVYKGTEDSKNCRNQKQNQEVDQNVYEEETSGTGRKLTH